MRAQDKDDNVVHFARLPGSWSLVWSVCALTVMGGVRVQAQSTEVILHDFAYRPHGTNPPTGVILDSAGNLYGTTTAGGIANAGVVYKVDTTGVETVLHAFSGGADGGQPRASVIRDSAGNLYGTTSSGGTAGQGVVFKLGTTGHESVLYNFTGGADGGQPYAGVVADSEGNLYGTTLVGGPASAGVVFKVGPTGLETVLYGFTGGVDGGSPQAGVIRDSAGNLYGTTSYGGTEGGGVVYKVDTGGRETVLYSFGANGFYPLAGVVRDSAGNLYGTTFYGGPERAGVVYKLDPSGNETVLHNFTVGPDGGSPTAGVILDSAGNLYGTTFGGGPGGVYGAGVVFKLDTSGNETVLYGFTNGAGGGWPSAGVTRDSAGNLYGTTTEGGPTSLGVVYQVGTTGNETVLYNFAEGTDGYSPAAGVIRNSAGELYGTTLNGGPANAGVVFSVDPTGHETVLYSFTGGNDGGLPYAGVILDSAGNLYGTTRAGGTANAGVVFKLDAAGNETVLYSFTGLADGGYPTASVILDSSGNLYGTASGGGEAGYGVVYELDATGHETVLYSFTGLADGAYPSAGVLLDPAGNLYGTTSFGGAAGAGVVFKLDTTGSESVLHAFTGFTDGGDPEAGVIRDSAGDLYGTTYSGGAAGFGVVYKLYPSGRYSVLYSFTGGADGSYPAAGVIGDSAGNLYGTTYYGGSATFGAVYKLDSTGKETVLYSFTGGADGGQPMAGVVRDGADNLYGTTSTGGGKAFGGVVFKIKSD
ncbi:MAG TPA: choice-of-anchor tandem repeat GloVer-containing protein [Bryobacteraceae bacterium]|nr:choice-of-anchor tandem repeat GloVer-containing protein [Bryobacteraceae bacterium]